MIEEDVVVESPRVARDEKPYFLSYKTVNYILGVIEALLFLRFIFKLSGANTGAGVVRFIYNFTEVLLLPFRFIFPTAAVGTIRFEWSTLVAMALYALIVYGIVGLLDLFRTADTDKV
jgi:hypothetical protein